MKEKAVIDVLPPATHWRITQLAEQIEKHWRDFVGSTDGSSDESLETSRTTGQAEGILMQRYGIGPDEAFVFLERLSRESETPVIETARKLVERRRVPDSEHVRRIREASRC